MTNLALLRPASNPSPSVTAPRPALREVLSRRSTYTAHLFGELCSRGGWSAEEAHDLVRRYCRAFEVELGNAGFARKPGTYYQLGQRRWSSGWLTETWADGNHALLDQAHVLGHLLGERAVAIRRGPRTRIVVIDIDAHDPEAYNPEADAWSAYAAVMERLGFPPHLLVRSPRGLHVYLMLAMAYPAAALGREFQERLCDLRTGAKVEVFPHDSNPVRLPLGPRSILLDAKGETLGGAHVDRRGRVFRNIRESLPLLLRLAEQVRLPDLGSLPRVPIWGGVPVDRRVAKANSDSTSSVVVGAFDHQGVEVSKGTLGVEVSKGTLGSRSISDDHRRVRDERAHECRYSRVSQVVFDAHADGLSEAEMLSHVQALLAADTTLVGRRNVDAEIRQQVKQAAKWWREKLKQAGRGGHRAATGHHRFALSRLVDEARRACAPSGWRSAARSHCPPWLSESLAHRHPWICAGMEVVAGLLAQAGAKAGDEVTLSTRALCRAAGRWRGEDRPPPECVPTLPMLPEEGGGSVAHRKSNGGALRWWLEWQPWLTRSGNAARGRHATVYRIVKALEGP